MEHALSRRKKITIAALALCINGAVVLFLFFSESLNDRITLFWETADQEKQIAALQPRHEAFEDDWATMQAQITPASVPIIFQDDDQFEDDQHDTQNMDALEHAQPIKEEQDVQPIEEHAETHAAASPVSLQEEAPVAAAPAREEPAEKKQSAPRPKKKRQMPRKQVTLADIANGFAAFQQAGTADVNMVGSHAGKATAEQLMVRRYLEKIVSSLQNSFRINRQKMPPDARSAHLERMEILMALDRGGRLVDLKLVSSSGSMEVDYFAMSIFRDAAGTFPAIPAGLKREIHTVIYSNVLSVFQAPFSLATISQR